MKINHSRKNLKERTDYFKIDSEFSQMIIIIKKLNLEKEINFLPRSIKE